ncbi:hypothetical protein CRM22_004012 [Opisthorchis felineus]|uniref:BZIP domain-containing protein n=2 Tax=Opisthorchis felineus TaxID=147828 RepID=A0A4S2LYC7_OPIFE|nr:hypothetical protein CRM22_004012 [Opisthorchis felineus]
MEPASTTEELSGSSTADKTASTSSRPTTLNIPVENPSPLLSSFRTPSLNDLQPILRSEVEKLLQQWKASSPQTPNSFLNPKHVTEEQECFANAFTQKLNELQDSGCLASITAAMSPTVINPNSLYNVSLPDMSSPNLSNFADLCRQAVQQQADLSTPPILLYSPTTLQSHPLTASQVKSSLVTASQQSSSFDLQKCANDLTNLQNQLQGAVSITLPVSALSGASKDLAALQLANRFKFEITTNGEVSQASVLKMLGLDAPSGEVSGTACSTATQPTVDSLLWPLRVQTSGANETVQAEGQQNSFLTSPRDDLDTRPSSVANSVDQAEIGRSLRSPSSVSSNSSTSHQNGADPPVGQGTRLDPTEQYRMRLERKRARNRDAARKCRERKIRLIKSLEKDVYHLSEENKALRNRVSRSRNEVDRLKSFVVNHLEKECPAIAGRVV